MGADLLMRLLNQTHNRAFPEPANGTSSSSSTELVFSPDDSESGNTSTTKFTNHNFNNFKSESECPESEIQIEEVNTQEKPSSEAAADNVNEATSADNDYIQNIVNTSSDSTNSDNSDSSDSEEESDDIVSFMRKNHPDFTSSSEKKSKPEAVTGGGSEPTEDDSEVTNTVNPPESGPETVLSSFSLTTTDNLHLDASLDSSNLSEPPPPPPLEEVESDSGRALPSNAPPPGLVRKDSGVYKFGTGTGSFGDLLEHAYALSNSNCNNYSISNNRPEPQCQPPLLAANNGNINGNGNKFDYTLPLLKRKRAIRQEWGFWARHRKAAQMNRACEPMETLFECLVDEVDENLDNNNLNLNINGNGCGNGTTGGFKRNLMVDEVEISE